MRILLTGSCGFILSNFIIYSLQETDWDLVSIDKLINSGLLKNVPQVKRHKLYVGDICDGNFVNKVFEVEKPDIIIHGAVESFTDKQTNNCVDFIQTNIIGTYNMLNAAKKCSVKKFINISTDEVYGNKNSGSFFENDKLNPTNPYASSKASADFIGQSYFHTYGLPVITTRISNTLGPRQCLDKFIPKIIQNSLNKKKISLFGDGKNIREWIYVKDNFYAIKTLIEKGINGEVYNISSNHEEKNIDVVKRILSLTGTSENLIEYVKDKPGHDFRYSMDCSKIKKLGWKPQYDFDEALQHTIGWYKANSWFMKG